MHLVKYIRINRKDPLKNMHGTTPEVAMLADVIESRSAISSVYQCVTWPHEPSSLPSDVLDSAWSTR